MSNGAAETWWSCTRAAELATQIAIAKYVEDIDGLVLLSPPSECSTVDTLARRAQDVDMLVAFSPGMEHEDDDASKVLPAFRPENDVESVSGWSNCHGLEL